MKKSTITSVALPLFLISSGCEGKATGVSIKNMMSGIRIAFEQVDVNKDGFLDLDEYKKEYTAIKEQFDVDKMAPNDFKELDKNGDMKISFDEFSRSQLLTSQCIDSNHDGFLSQEEIDSRQAECSRLQVSGSQ